MKVFVAVLAIAAVANAGGLVPKHLVEMAKSAKLAESCWGEEATGEWSKSVKDAVKECEKQEPSYQIEDIFGNKDVSRVTRDADEDAKIAKFVMYLGDYKEDKVEGLSNLTCVMKKIKFWNEDNTVNLDYFLGEHLDRGNFDAELKELFVEDLNNCYKISEALPVEDQRNPIKKKFGKQMFFQKCMFKSSEQLCTMKTIAEQIEKVHGEITEEKLTKMHLPKNKYHAGLMKKLVMSKNKSPSKKCISKLLFAGKSDC